MAPPSNASGDSEHSSSSADEALSRVHKIVNLFLERPDSGPFREPVDWRGLELYDYPDIIKKPMDLGTIHRKLERKQYNCAAEAAYDIRLVWKNCMTYNAEGSDFWLLAKSYARRFEDRYRKIRNEFDVGEEPVDTEEEAEEEEKSSEDEMGQDDGDEEYEVSTPTSSKKQRASTGSTNSTTTSALPKLDARARFASNLFLLNGIELGHVISMIEKQCPNALEAGPELEVPEKLEIIIDNIEPADVFNTISQYAEGKAAKKRGLLPTPKLEDVSRRRARK